MRGVPAGIQMIVNRENKIIQIQFDERRLRRVTQVLGEMVSLELGGEFEGNNLSGGEQTR
jgi:hypothetical protein